MTLYIPEKGTTNPRWENIVKDIDIEPRYDINTPIPKDTTHYSPRSFYMNNRNVKRAGVVTNFTQEMIDEIRRCKDDIVYFASKYFFIRTLDYGRIKIPLYDYQKFILRLNDYPEIRFKQWLAARQSAKSTTLTIEILHDIIFNEAFEAGIVAQVRTTAMEIFSRVRMAYEMLPFFLQPGVIEFTKGGVLLENGSKVFSASSKPDSLRGFSLNSVLVDEGAFVRNMDEFMRATFPTISSGKTSKFSLVSSPNGRKGFFYNNWIQAIKGKNDYFTIQVPWHRVPGRDEEWKKSEIERTDLLKFRQEHNCEFLSTSLSLVDSFKLEAAEDNVIDPIIIDGALKIYEEPVEEHRYIMTVDTAEGKLQDSSSFIVFDVSGDVYKTVATYESNEISPMLFPYHVAKTASDYNEAIVVIENNNSSGALVSRILHHEIEYDNIYCEHRKDDTGVGIRTTQKTKNLGCMTLKDIFEKDKLLILSAEVLSQLSNFEETGNSYAGADGEHDDFAMNLVVFSWFTHSDEFQEYLKGSTITKELYGQEGAVILDVEKEHEEFISIEDFW